jgi:hypothetical protein
MVHTCNPSIWEAKAGRLFEASLGYITSSRTAWNMARPCHIKQDKKTLHMNVYSQKLETPDILQ